MSNSGRSISFNTHCYCICQHLGRCHQVNVGPYISSIHAKRCYEIPAESCTTAVGLTFTKLGGFFCSRYFWVDFAQAPKVFATDRNDVMMPQGLQLNFPKWEQNSSSPFFWGGDALFSRKVRVGHRAQDKSSWVGLSSLVAKGVKSMWWLLRILHHPDIRSNPLIVRISD